MERDRQGISSHADGNAECVGRSAKEENHRNDSSSSSASKVRRERPILFTPHNAQLVHESKKTQTRRIVKDINPTFLLESPTGQQIHNAMRCPYGVVGDRLWIREKHWRVEIEGGGIGNGFLVFDNEWVKGMPEPIEERPWLDDCDKWGARPSIHMPRWACRTVVELTEVRVERVQEITEADALAEGCGTTLPLGPTYEGWADTVHRELFKQLWESINGKDSWAKNPYVWVLSFRRIHAS